VVGSSQAVPHRQNVVQPGNNCEGEGRPQKTQSGNRHPARLVHFQQQDKERRRLGDPVGGEGYVPLPEKASDSSVFCSISWAPAEPVAGLALAERFTDSTARSPARWRRRGIM